MQQMRLRLLRRLPIGFGWLTKARGHRHRTMDETGLVEIPDSYTLIPLDQPARLAQIIRDFTQSANIDD